MEQFFPIPTYWTELFCPILPYLTKPYILIIMATPITNFNPMSPKEGSA